MPTSDFVVIRDRLARRTPRRIAKPTAVQAAVALILTPAVLRDELALLLIKRAERGGDPWSGQMALPGGRRDPQDRELLATARRETEEETGIALSADVLLGELDDLHPRTRILPPIVVRPFVFGLPSRPPVQASEEVALHIWVPIQELKASQTHVEVDIRGQRRHQPSFLIGHHVVWGMTHRILKPFLALAG
jgi:8-oxo-dGTP pyrophosphatase MutT (NUDIX family)